MARALRFDAGMKAPEVLVLAIAGAALAVCFALACGGTTADAPHDTTPSFDDDASMPPLVSTATVTSPPLVADAAQASLDATSGGGDDVAIVGDASVDASVDAPVEAPSSVPPFDASGGGTCGRSAALGDLVVDELMIASVAGSGDDGEWIEVSSALDCAIDLIGLHGEAPRGSQVATFDVADHLWLPARGTFVIADSTDPAINHYLPGTVIGWFGHPGDVLRNQGTSITLTSGGALVDSVTYPSLAPTPGTSIAFPADCDAGARADWAIWQASTASWFPQFEGTPNASNADVHCR
jgi:hypothetical protein